MAKYRNKNHSLQTTLAIIKALSDENRLRVLLALRGCELCVCQITEFLDLAPSTVSKHLSILKQAGLVESRKEGRWIFYRFPMTEDHDMAESTRNWLLEMLGNDKTIKMDDKNVKAILKMDVEELCRKQCPK